MVFIKVRRLRFAFIGGAPLTVTLCRKMEPLAEIRERLRNRPDLHVVEEDKGIIVKAPSKHGFDVSFFDDGSEYTVSFDGWHEHFELADVARALDCFCFGLSDKCRLKVCSRGGYNYKWTLEAFEDGKWVAYSTTGLLFLSFWRKKTVRYLSNGNA